MEEVHMVVNNLLKVCLVSLVFTLSSPVFADTYGQGTYGSERYSGNNSTTTAPGAPTSIVAVAGNSQANISFTPPANNGGAAISAYIAISSPGNIVVTGLSSPITIAGLTNGTAYTFTMTAVNSVGTSSTSTVSNSITPVAPTNTQSTGSNYGGGGSTSGSSYIPTSLINTFAVNTPVVNENVQIGLSNFSNNLTVGTVNIEIKSLQQFLNKQGFTISDTGPGSVGKETTLFGSATKAALIRFQKANNISPAIGYFGPLTRLLINSLLNTNTSTKNNSTSTISTVKNISVYSRDLDVNMIGGDVRALQQFLNKNGYMISETGPGSIGNETNKFGPATRAALIKFQKANQLSPAIGYFGPLTRKLVETLNK